jgi:hypothetical protein
MSLYYEKQLFSYIKDNKIKSELEYPLSNDGILYINNIEKRIDISVHLSNTEAKLVWQLDNLVKLINTYKNYTIYLFGDFNVVPMKDESVDNKLYFLKKNEKLLRKIERLDIECEFLHHKILFKECDFNTTCKVRVITAQIDKMLEVATDKIDSIIVLYPNDIEINKTINHSLHYFTNNNNILKENIITENTLYPIEWLSDHSLLKTTITNGLSSQTLISLNICGESQSNEKSYNWGEFAVKSFYDFVIENTSLHELKREIFNSTEIFGKPIMIGDIQINNLKELIIKDKKYFCENFKNKGLRECQAVNYHINQAFNYDINENKNNDIIKYYEIMSDSLNIDLLKNGNIDGNYDKFLKLQHIFSGIMNYEFKNKNNTQVSLSTPFNSWYNLAESINKIKIVDILDYYLKRHVDVIALQEVSIHTLFLIENLLTTKYNNYILVKPPYNYYENNTIGILLIFH